MVHAAKLTGRQDDTELILYHLHIQLAHSGDTGYPVLALRGALSVHAPRLAEIDQLHVQPIAFALHQSR
jgi:hypothetical protein